jgi:hypothetical protein
MLEITLPSCNGTLESYRLEGTPLVAPKPPRAFNRVALAAAHVVADPLSPAEPSGVPALDWEGTLVYRHHLLDLGFGIAEAMDTSQRGMGLDWPTARKLIRRTLEATAFRKDALIYSGAGTDHLDPKDARSLDDVIRAYLEQVEAIQKLGGRIILMASRALTRLAGSPQDYVRVYSRVLAEADQPMILHWLGEMFDPALAGYWGANDFAAAVETCLDVIERNSAKVDGIKISLLDDQKELAMRRRLPHGVKMYTGDDFNYPDLIAGDGQEHSHALLGIFDAIAPAASIALSALAEKDITRYHRAFAPTVPLSRLIFRSPTQYYKTGIVFIAWLNGHQDHFVMVAGHQAMRPLAYFAEAFRLADKAGLLSDPEQAIGRMRKLLAVYGL